MIHFHLYNSNEERTFQHSEGPLELGRGPQRNVPRQTVNDPYMSFNQMVVTELENRPIRIENISEHVPVEIEGSEPIALLSTRIVKLPVHLRIGRTNLQISAGPDPEELEPFAKTLRPSVHGSTERPSLRDLGDAPDAETLAQWFETVICVQQAATSSSEFFIETARAVVELVGLDRGMVLLREGEQYGRLSRSTRTQTVMEAHESI